MMRKTQFFTQKKVAIQCFLIATEIIENLDIKNPFFVEPSAGDGVFLKLMPPDKRLGIDIEPKDPEIEELSYFRLNLNVIPRPAVVIGNPPFGFHNDLTIRFINISAKYADLIGFIVPKNFNRWYYSQHLDPSLHLIYNEPLTDSYFIAKEYNNQKKERPSNFMVWSKELGPYTDMRLREEPITQHPDFEMKTLCYNTLAELGRNFRPVLNGRRFVCAIRNSEWRDSPKIGEVVTEFWDIKLRNPITNWLLLYSNDPVVRRRLITMNYKPIYISRLMHHGFNKSDLVKEYTRLYPTKKTGQLSLF